MATRKIADLTQATTASDADLMVIQDTSKTKKITFSTLLTSIKSKLGVGTAANLNTTSKEIVGAINEINTNLGGIILYAGTASEIGSYSLADQIRNYRFIEILGMNSILNTMPWSIKLRVSNITDDYSYVIAHSRNLFVTNFRVSFKANSFKITENNRMQVQSGATTEYVQELIYNIVGYK